MPDRLEETISQLKAHAITLEEAYKRLEFLAWEQEKDQCKQDQLRVDTLVDADVPTYGQSPEETLVKRENTAEYQELLRSIRSQLTIQQKRVFNMRYIKGYTQENIGKKLRMTQPAIFKILRVIDEVLTGYANESTHDILVKSQVRPWIHTNSSKVRWPFEFMASQKPCKVHQYLEEYVCCTWCDKCTNKNMKQWN